MRITLIKPNIGIRNSSYKKDDASMEPLPLAVLAALTPSDIEVKMYDDRIEDINFDEKTDLACITVETYTAKRAYEISAEYKKRHVKVIMGGMHVKLLPEEVKKHCDSIMDGDAEDKWAEMIEDLRKNKLKKLYHCNPVCIPQAGVIARRDIYEGKKYLPLTLIQFSRGCPNSCRYCATSKYFERRHTCRNIEDVIFEIKSQKRKFIFFVDDNIVANKKKAKELFKALIPLKIKWVSQGSIDMTEDDELLKLMVKSGCLGLVIGFESIKPSSVDFMNKTVNKRFVKDNYKTAIKKLRKYGIQTWAAFTIGHDSDTVESIKETYRFAEKNKFAFSAFNILMPYPSTPLYEQLKKENRLLYNGEWWLNEDYLFNYASFIPKNMTPEELTEVAFWCRRKHNSIWSIIHRAFDFKTNMRNPLRFFVYIAYNPLFRKEVFEKQGMLFGYKNKNLKDKKNGRIK